MSEDAHCPDWLIGRDSCIDVILRDIRVDTFFGEIRFDNLNQNIGHDPAVPWLQEIFSDTQLFQFFSFQNSSYHLAFRQAQCLEVLQVQPGTGDPPKSIRTSVPLTANYFLHF